MGTINQRAQRFRTRAACLAWCKREGTRAKNETILKIIPEKFKNAAVNSTKGFRELTKAEIAIVENKSIMPSRQKREKRKTRGKDSDDDNDGKQAPLLSLENHLSIVGAGVGSSRPILKKPVFLGHAASSTAKLAISITRSTLWNLRFSVVLITGNAGGRGSCICSCKET